MPLKDENASNQDCITNHSHHAPGHDIVVSDMPSASSELEILILPLCVVTDNNNLNLLFHTVYFIQV